MLVLLWVRSGVFFYCFFVWVLLRDCVVRGCFPRFFVHGSRARIWDTTKTTPTSDIFSIFIPVPIMHTYHPIRLLLLHHPHSLPFPSPPEREYSSPSSF